MTIRVHSSNITAGGIFVTHIYGAAGDIHYMTTDALCRPGVSNNVTMTYQAVGASVTVSGTLEDTREVMAIPTSANWVSATNVPVGTMVNSPFQYTALKIQFAGTGCIHISMN